MSAAMLSSVTSSGMPVAVSIARSLIWRRSAWRAIVMLALVLVSAVLDTVAFSATDAMAFAPQLTTGTCTTVDPLPFMLRSWVMLGWLTSDAVSVSLVTTNWLRMAATRALPDRPEK